MTSPATPPPELKEMVEELVRTYVFRAMRRYVPFIVGLATLALIVALVPSVSPPDNGGFNANATGVNGNGTNGSDLSASGDASSNADTGAGTAAGAGGSTAAGRTGGAGGKTTTQEGKAAVTVDCARRQVSWSKNGPCVTTYTGSNGGTTSPGVTAKEINVSFRLSTSGQSAAVEALAAGDNQVQSQVLADMKVFVDYFNTQFQLYGRKVVLKDFTGQGDWLAEYQGQNLAGAQADAATAKGMNAFLDLSPAATSSSPPYCTDLAQEKIICAGGVVETNSYMSKYYPYAMSPIATLDFIENYWVAMACQRMAGLNAIFSGDTVYQNSKRKFGIIALEQPEYDKVINDAEAKMNACGATVVRKISYPIDVTTLAAQDQNIVAQMHSAGVTTVMCFCDTLSPTLLTQAAEEQRWFPEWMAINVGDGYGQQRRPSEWGHAFMTAGTQIPPKDSEPYKVYKRANPTGEPAERPIWFAATYYAALAAFSTLQQAGPNLNPTSFMNGLFTLPPSLPGAKADGIPWAPGKGVFALLDQAPIGYWDVNATSPTNDMAGTTRSCAGADGDWHPIQKFEPSAYGPKGTQLHCFGK